METHERHVILEKIIQSEELVSPFLYVNPKRKKQIFLDFVRAMAMMQGIVIKEKEVSLKEEWLGHFQHIGVFASEFKERPRESVYNILDDILSIVLTPLAYPLLGGDANAIRCGDDKIVIFRPKYQGLIPDYDGDNEIHEYLHAYHKVVAYTLWRTGVLECDAYSAVGIEPPTLFRAPTKRHLKNFERKFLKKALSLEKSGRAKPHRVASVPETYRVSQEDLKRMI